MPIESFLLMILAAIVALGVVFYKYFYGTKSGEKRIYLLAAFRFISIFILLILLINPKIDRTQYTIEKPRLLIALDQSRSMEYLEASDSSRALVEYLGKHEELLEQFDIQTYGFGKNLNRLTLDSLVFDGEHTNISQALKELSALHTSGRETAVVLITDGNQTIGRDFQYFTPQEGFNIYPVIAGDTTKQPDISISTLNVNRYAFLNNSFPVELIVTYTGDVPVSTTLEITSSDNRVVRRSLNLDKKNSSEVVSMSLPAQTIGTLLYTAEVGSLKGEKNTSNNLRQFAVEVIDERTSVLILTDHSHPDLGMFKRSIESNEQRRVSIATIEDVDMDHLSDYQLVILYQPNTNFKAVFSELKRRPMNFFLVTGTLTDWNFVNSVMPFSKDITNVPQEYTPVFNPHYTGYQIEDIGFADVPPLEDAFGTLGLQHYSALLFQQAEGVTSDSPLLATFEDDSSRYAVLFGANIWRWRSQTFTKKESFEDFDLFLGKLVRFLTSSQTRDRLIVTNESFYQGNDPIEITARYFDNSYQFDPTGELTITISDTADQVELQAPMSVRTNDYKVVMDHLEAGTYQFNVTEGISGLTRSGAFSVSAYEAEHQFSSSNFSELQQLVSDSSDQVYFLSQEAILSNDLLGNKHLVKVQKSREKTVSLIDWKILLVLLLIALSSEWFTRKYFGLI